jgi:glycosyltransferase involved in cell wall biosynthesis
MVNAYHYNRGGDCTYTFALTDLLRSNGHEVIPFAMHHPNNLDSEYSKYFVSYIDYAQALNNFNLKEAGKVAFRSIYSTEAKRKIETVIKDLKPDIAHLGNIHNQLTPSILKPLKKANIPTIWTLHDFKLICPNDSLYNRGEICEKCGKGKYYHPVTTKCKKGSLPASLLSSIEAYTYHLLKTYNGVDAFIAPSKFLKEKLINNGFDKTKVFFLPNYIDAKESDIPDVEDDYYLYYGRLSIGKGLETLLKAAGELPNTKLLIAGDGPDRQYFEDQVIKNNLKNIKFLGFLGGSKLKNAIRKSMFTVQPSEFFENCPYSVLESFAMQKPVIGTQIGGIAELIDDGKTGFLFKPRDYKELKTKINTLASDRLLRKNMGKNAFSKVENDHNPSKYYNALIEIYEGTKLA